MPLQGRAGLLFLHVREITVTPCLCSTFLTQEFMDRYNLFVAGKRLNKSKMVWEYYIRSRDASDTGDDSGFALSPAPYNG
jgi:stage V sporulation protein R